jgi:hypothetical protein
VGTGDSFDEVDTGQLAAIAIDEQNQRAIVTQGYSEKMVFAIDLVTGNRKLFSNVSAQNLYNYDRDNLNQFFSIAIADPNGYAFAADSGLNALLAIDLVTGQRVIFSKE